MECLVSVYGVANIIWKIISGRWLTQNVQLKQFPVADGYAEYMVASMKPLELVHIPLGDAWQFEYAHRLTAKDVQDKIDQQKALEELFNKKKEGQ